MYRTSSVEVTDQQQLYRNPRLYFPVNCLINNVTIVETISNVDVVI